MRTKKNLKTSLEPLQPLNLLNQFFLVIKDQQQVLKDQLSVTAMLMKKVNVASNTVHRVTIPKEDSVLSRSLRSDRWWAFDNYTGNTQVCSSSRIILLLDYWKWNSTWHMQLGPYTVCTTISLYLNDRAYNFGNMKIEVPKGSWRSNQTHVGTLCGYLRKSSRNKSQNEIPCTEASAQEVQGYCKQLAAAEHSDFFNPGLTTRFWISRT